MLQSAEILEFVKPVHQEATAHFRSRPHGLKTFFVILIWLSISFFAPLFLLLVYRGYATTNGAVLETGCHGPDLPFGLLSGIMLPLLLRM